MESKENQTVSEENEQTEVADQEKVSSSEQGNGSKATSSEEDDYKKRYFYLAAEMDNLTKRFQREKEGIIKFSNERLLGDLLEVMDNFDRTLQAISLDNDSKVKNIAVGIQMVKNQFMEALKKYGLAEVESIGKAFDPHLHEAVSQRDEEGKEDHLVLEEFQKGYTLNGRLIRASKVVVCTKNS